MIEFDEPVREVGGVFKYYVDKLIPIRDLLSRKTTKLIGYEVQQSCEWIIWLKSISRYSQEDFDEFFL